MTRDDIFDFISNHMPPYVYNNDFKEGDTVYYSGPYWDSAELTAGVHAFLTGRWVSAGEKVRRFESDFNKEFGHKHSVMTNSGSSANLALITGLKIYYNWADDDEVIVSVVGFPTTISVLYQNRLKPVFVDIEYDTLNFDVTKIEEKITPRTKAIFVSPVLGNPPDMDRLVEISEKHGLLLIGDNCDSLGTKWKGKDISSYYIASSHSFYPAHHLTTGEGGMVSTNVSELDKVVRSVINWGRACYCVGQANLLPNGTCGERFCNWLENYDGIVDHKYVFDNMGYNLKPLDLQGAIGSEQLKKMADIFAKRKRHKELITNMFVDKGLARTAKSHPNADVCWFGTPFICASKEHKRSLVDYLEKNKIQTRNYFAGNILLHPGFSRLDDYKKYPNANRVLDDVFFIGCSPHYTEGTLSYIQKIVDAI